MGFYDWLLTCTKSNGELLSRTSADHYARGVRAVSKDMLSEGVISKDLEQMELYELDLAIALIFKNRYFLNKDEVGNKMYSNALKRFRCFVYLSSEKGIEEEKEEQKILSDDNIAVTERETIVRARVGQGLYRQRIMEKYGGRCIITGLGIKQTLVASHIKPWAICNNEERVCRDNGLLLSATYDKLFDSGLITFTQDGKLVLSDLIPSAEANILNITGGNTYDIGFNSNMVGFIQYHNENIFIGRI